MPDNETRLVKDPTRAPWNKGKLIGAKPPLRPRHVLDAVAPRSMRLVRQKLKRSPLKMGLSRCNVDMRRYRHCTVASAVTIAPGTNFSDVLGQFFLVGTPQAYAN